MKNWETQNVNVAGRSVIKVFLKTEFADLGEVVVVGYGTQRKSDLTGAVVKVGADDLKNRSTSDAAVALQGKALLWKGDYAGARDALKQVISSGKYKLLPFPKRAVDLNSGLKQNPNWD